MGNNNKVQQNIDENKQKDEKVQPNKQILKNQNLSTEPRNASMLGKIMMFSQFFSKESSQKKSNQSSEKYCNIVPTSDDRLMIKNKSVADHQIYRSQQLIEPQINLELKKSGSKRLSLVESQNTEMQEFYKGYQIVVRGINKSVIIRNQQDTPKLKHQQTNPQVMKGKANDDFVVPFKVVKLSLSEHIYSQIQRLEPRLLSIWQKPREMKIFSKNKMHPSWRLLQNGMYFYPHKGEETAHQMGVCVNGKYYYQGSFYYQKKDQVNTNSNKINSIEYLSNRFIPDGYGLYICDIYSYKGEIKQTKADGYGQYFSQKVVSKNFQPYSKKQNLPNTLTSIDQRAIQNKLLCCSLKGDWKEGQCIKGELILSLKLSSQQKKKLMKYTGSFKSLGFHGKGELQLFNYLTDLSEVKNQNILYKGNFVNGLYSDREEAYYECQNYIYKGQFKNGFKNGLGILSHKKMKKTFTGVWINDRIQNPTIKLITKFTKTISLNQMFPEKEKQ